MPRGHAGMKNGDAYRAPVGIAVMANDGFVRSKAVTALQVVSFDRIKPYVRSLRRATIRGQIQKGR